MPGVDRECEGPGATHYHACKCREEYFRKLEAKLKAAKEALMYTEGNIGCIQNGGGDLCSALDQNSERSSQ